ncbi:hypothetical protein CGRA01v4_05749 [Colletotrichum graminicola]|nr:hypothetical protein CGRA01v4_05749 [Colletotrichum graminicola]
MSRWLRAAWLQGQGGVTGGTGSQSLSLSLFRSPSLTPSYLVPIFPLVILVANAKPDDSTGCLPLRPRDWWARRVGVRVMASHPSPALGK